MVSVINLINNALRQQPFNQDRRRHYLAGEYGVKSLTLTFQSLQQKKIVALPSVAHNDEDRDSGDIKLNYLA